MSASWFCLCGQRWSTETNPDSSDSLPPCPACGEPAAGELAEEDPSSLETTDIPVVSPLPSESNPPAEVTEEILDALPVEPGSAPASEGPTIVVPPQQGEAGGNAARGEAPLRLMPDLPLRNPGSQTRDVEASKPPTPASESATLPPGEALSRSGTQRVWPNVPGYELLEEVGRGGMGVVFKARQVRLDRIVALKMILAGAHAGTQEIARFRTEAEAVARLDHPHIVQIYAIGEHAGRPFLALEFVEGGSLEEVISRGAEAPTLGEDPAGGDSQPPRKQARPLTPIKAAELLAKIAGAIHVAHRRGIIHRDLKPANILLTEEGEPKIADFGLAKQLDAQTRTQTGAVVGTPSYMAPEQAGGKKKEIGPHTDVYALGAILYECLTGRPPFKAETPLDTILQVVSEECRPPSQINPRVPRDLETICLKCLRKSPRERYFSARALAVDCSAFARGEPIQARRSSFLERSARWVWKHPLLTATTCLLFFVLLGLGLWYADDLNRIIHNEGRLVVNSEVTDVKEGRLLLKRGENVVRQWHLHSYRFRSIPAGTYQVEAESPTVALEVEPSEITITRNGQVTVRVFPGSVRSLGRLSGHTGVVRGLALSPDGRWALSASPSFPVGDETLRLWDVAGRKMIQQFEEVQGGICAVAFGPEGKRVLAGGEDGKVHLWHLEPGDSPASPPRPGLHKVLLGHSGAVHTVAFSADGQRAASAGKDRLIRIWNLRTLEMEQVLKGHSDTVTRVLFVPGQHRILSGSRDHSLRLWDLKTGRQVGWFPPHPGMVLGVACSPSGDRAITGCEDGKVRLWEIPLSDNQGQGGMGGRQRPPRCNEGRLLRVFPGHTHAVTWVAYAPDGKQIFSASLDRTVRIWEPKSGKHQASLTGHGDGVLSLAFCPRTRQMLSAGGVNDIAGWNIGQDFNLHLWQVPGPLTIEQEYPETFNQPLATLPGHTSEVRGVGFVPGEHKLLSSGYDGQPRLWDLDTGKIEQSFASPAGRILVQAISPDGKLALTGSVENQLCLWDLDKGALRQSYPGHTGQVCGVDFSPDLNLVLSGGGYDRTAWLRERKTGKVLQRYIGHLSPVEQARFSPDGKQVATCSHDGTIKIWDRDTGKELRTLIGHTSQVWSIAYFPGGKRLASGSHDGTVRIWEVATGKQLRRFEGHRGIVYSVAVSPDGTCLLSAGSDRLVRLWSVSTGKMLAVLAGHSREIFQVAFSPGGNFAASASKDQTIHLWQLPEVTEPAETEISEPEKGLLLVKSDDPTVRVLVRKSNQPYTLLAPAIHGAYPLEPGSYTFELQGEQRSRKLSATGLTILAGNKYVLDLVHNPQFVGVLWEKTPEGPGRFCRLAVCPDGEHFLVTRSGGVVELRNLGSGSIVQSGFTPKGLDSKAKGRAAHPGAEGRSGNALGPKAGATPPDPQSAIRNPQSAIEGLSTLDIWGLALSQDGKQALTSSQDGTLQLWELGQHPEGMRPVRTYTAFSRDPHAVAFLPDGEHALANGPGHSIVLWSLETGQPIRTFTGHTGTVVRLVCSRDGETFFSASGDGTVRQWHLETGKEVRRFLDHTGRVEALAVSPDGTRLASGGLDHTIRIWDSGTGKVLRRLVGHRDWVLSLAFSPDGSRLLSSGQDGSVRFWDVEEGKELRRYVSRSGGAEAVAFCRDGTLALSAQPERLALAQLPLYRPGLQGPISDSPGQIVFEPDHTGLSVQMMSSTGLKRAYLRGDHQAFPQALSPGALLDLPAGTYQLRPSGGGSDGVLAPTTLTLAGGTQQVVTYREMFKPSRAHSEPASGGNGLHPSAEKAWEQLQERANAPSPRQEALAEEARQLIRTYPGTPSAVRAAQLLATLPAPLDRLDPNTIPRQEREAFTRAGFEAREPGGQEERLVAILGESRLVMWGGKAGWHSPRVAFHPDGQTLASGGSDGLVYLWDATTGQLRAQLTGHLRAGIIRDGRTRGPIQALTFSPDGKWLASAGQDQTVRLWDPATGKEVHVCSGHVGRVHALAFAPDGKQLASAGEAGFIRLWDVQTGKLIRIGEARLSGKQRAWVLALAFSSDGKTLAWSGERGAVRLWEVETEKEQALKGFEARVTALAFLGTTLVGAGGDGVIRLWDVKTGKELHSFQAHDTAIQDLQVDEAGGTLVSAGRDGTVRVWDVQTGQPRHILKGHPQGVTGLALARGGKRLASVGRLGVIRLWELPSGQETPVSAERKRGVLGKVNTVALSSDGQTIAAAGTDGIVYFWQSETGKLVETLWVRGEPDTAPVRALAFSPDGKYLAIARGSWVTLWDRKEAKEANGFQAAQEDAEVLVLAFSPTGQRLASGASSGEVRWSSIPDGGYSSLPSLEGPIRALAFSPDGQTLAFAGPGQVVYFCRPHYGDSWQSRVAQNEVRLAFSPDGDELITAGAFSTVKRWSRTSALPAQQWTGSWGLARALAWSPDGKTVALASQDGMVHLWDTGTGKEQARWRVAPPGQSARALAFSPESRHLITANANGTLFLFRLGPPPIR